MGTNITGIGNANAIGFKSKVTGGIYFPPELKDALVGVWSAYGKSNDSTDRNIIKNKIKDRGGDFVISNAAFKLNSGYGGYVEDYSGWTGFDTITVNTDRSKFTVKVAPANLYYLRASIGRDIESFKIKITNFTEGRFFYSYVNSEGREQKIYFTPESIQSNNVVILPKSWNTLENVSGYTEGFFFEKSCNIGITIEQLPLYQSAFVTDGIDDLITSTKTVQEMGITDEVTVVSMIHQIDKPSNFITTNNIRTSESVVGRNAISLTDKTGIYGWYKDNIQGSTINVINNILGDKADYTASASSNTNLSSKFSVVGYISNDSIVETSQVAWYWTIIANKVLTTDQINQVIAYFNLDRTLNPDILCYIEKQGITNENHAEFGDKLIDFSGNGRDIQLNNIAWKGNSGIGKYETDFLDSSIWKYKTNSSVTSDKIVCNKAATHIMLLYYSITDENKYDVPSFNVLKQGDASEYYYIDEQGTRRTFKLLDGINTLPASHGTLFTGTEETCGFGNPGIGNSVTITQIPSHAGALCLDGVNDFGKVTGLPIYKDYTVIADYERTDIGNIESVGTSPVLSKSYTAGQGSFIMNFIASTGNSIRSYSFGTENTSNFNDLARQIFYQSKYKNQGFDITAGTGVDGDSLWLGTARDNDSCFFNGAIYSLMSFPYSMSEFLIERQLKKHKLGTLYPDMVEFRPIIPEDENIIRIDYFVVNSGTQTVIKSGDYVDVGSRIIINVYTKFPYKVEKVSSLAFTSMSVEPSTRLNAFDVKGYIKDKTPQKIKLTLAVNEDIVQWNPIITANANYKIHYYLIDSNNVWKSIKTGDYITIGAKLAFQITFDNDASELKEVVSSQLSDIVIEKILSASGYNIYSTITSKSPQKINITIDEYIRYEDIVQPYPVLLRFNDENGNEVSWGGKFKVGSTITRIGSAADSNLLPNIYNIFGLLLNGNQTTSSKAIVEKTMVFKAKSAYIFDNNEPKCILSPSRLRIPNSSYKILGYIPDISGHGNNGVIHNSAYVEGSGVNEDGSYQFDGVDDFVTIPTVTGGGKQVLMKVNNNTINSMLYDQRSSGTSPNSLYNDFAIYCTNSANNNQIAYQSRLVGNTYIDGILNTNIACEDLLGVLHNITITCDIVVPNNGVVPNIGRGGILKDFYSKVALYDFMLFDNISTDDKIKELNEYVGIEAKVELPPYRDAYGKTNLDADKATIQQRGTAVGDYDLTNYNHAYDKMSGY